MPSVNDDLKSELENYLGRDEIDGFSKGDLTLFVNDSRYKFFRVVDNGYQRADVALDKHPDSDADMRLYHDVYEIRARDVLDTIHNINDIKTYPVEVGFGEMAK